MNSVDIAIVILGIIAVLVVGGIAFVNSKDPGSGWDDDDSGGWG